LVEVFDCAAGVAATAAAVTDRLEVESSSPVVTGVAVVDVVALVALVVLVAVDVFVVASMQPVRPSMLTMLSVPAILRARRAG
jgi:hypothetical protein